jgi:hypothetical protein
MSLIQDIRDLPVQSKVKIIGLTVWYWLFLLALYLVLPCCQYNNCTFTSANLKSGGEMTSDLRQVPVDKSTQGAVSANQTVSPSTSLSGIPGM